MKKKERREIPFFDYPHLFKEHEKEYSEIIHDVLERGAYIMQRDLEEFEDRLAGFLDVRHAIGTGDGTMAILMGLMAAGIQQGDEVILPSHTFVATAAAVHHAGATPVLADCGKDHLLDPDLIERHITPRTRAIMPVHLNGRVCDMDGIMRVAEKHGLIVTEDACQALGAKYKDRLAGAFGEAGAFSFYPSKTLGCFGDGGAVVTNDDGIAEQVRLLRDHGRASNGDVRVYGFNTRLDNLYAAVLCYKLNRYPEEIERRRRLAQHYDDRLRNIPTLLLPPGPMADADHLDIYQNYEIEADDRDGLRAHLSEHGIGTILQWGGRCIHQFKELGAFDPLPVTDEMTKRFMLLPMNGSLGAEGVDYICDAIKQFYGHE